MTAAFDLRPPQPSDVAAIQRVSESTGQPPVDSGADAAYVEFVMRTGRVFCAVAAGHTVVGWGAVRDNPLGSMLTDLFVFPDHQGSGIGRALLGALWPAADRGPRFTFSSRHPAALPVYARAGLIPVWPLLYLSGPRPETSTVAVRTVDGVAAAAAERSLVGADRSDDYRFWLRRPGAAAVVLHDGGRLVACGAIRGGALLHLCCPTEQDADTAVRSALAAADSDPVSVCLPGPHPSVPSLLESGFRITEYDLAMCTAGLALPTTSAYSPGLG